MSATKWEYRVARYQYNSETEEARDYQDWLNEMGDTRWELIEIRDRGHIFKREKLSRDRLDP